ncbi:ATP-binding cassette domain-containing protein [Nocardia sp. CDC159]|uniref:ATP-binding cassette domain-containing protein n=1 Tax=Nocardia pulmonis TaxID=2951408 RepID=A0A9X2IZS2_9NOCA|nr:MULTISPECIES: ATP-binding cassette domain-containing protein [Nocardia]MCM6776994.1 ATP-binding cassette domain-containing protein [Nocardia pulmonis]MCM6789418.1 ATP-binding cassette domain-containing protein [Nocardia sp. CDC159]
MGRYAVALNVPGGLEVSMRLAARDVTVELTVAPGEVLAVLGPNGAGKSTLLEVVAGLLRPDTGRIELGGRTLTDVSGATLVPPHRRGISMLAQDPLLFPHLSVAANVAFGPRSRGLRPRAARAVAREWLAAVDAVALAERRPGELSGGQAQRVALARALAVEPDLVLLDEPMAALDVATAPAMRALLRRVLRGERNGKGATAILVTHDIVDALTLADRVVVLESGRIVEQGPVATVLSRPRSAFAARIAGVNLLLGTAVSAGRVRGAAPESAGSAHTGAVRSGDDLVYGRCVGEWTVGASAAAVFSPAAVAVYREYPAGSPRNVFRVDIAELTDRGGIVRVHAADRPGGAGLVADLTPGAAAELALAPGMSVYFAVKAIEVQVYPC